jgi:hypothetical protein
MYRLLALWQTGTFVLMEHLGPHRSRTGRASSARWTRVPWRHHAVVKVIRQYPVNRRNEAMVAITPFGARSAIGAI